MKYGRINELRRQHPVAAMCRVLDVSESGYYAWRKRPRSPRAQKNAQLETQIKAAHERTRQTYGPERLQADLADNGIRGGHSIASGGFAKNSGYAASRNASSRRRRTRIMPCRSHRTFWIGSLPLLRRTKPG